MFLDGYGSSGYWCWVRIDHIDPTKKNLLIVFILFFYLWIAMVYNSVLIFMTFRYFKSYANGQLMNMYNRQLKKTIYFPVAMVMLWIIPSFYRILQMSEHEVFALSLIHAFCEGINGFVNTVIYAGSKKFREELKSSLLISGDNFLTSL